MAKEKETSAVEAVQEMLEEVTKSGDVEMTPEEAATLERRARLAQLLDRGVTAHKLDVEYLPHELFGTWVRDLPDDITRYRALGFEIETEHVKGEGHGQGDNREVVGDLVLMTTSRQNYEDIRSVQDDRKERRQAPRHQYMQQAKANPDVPVIDQSSMQVKVL